MHYDLTHVQVEGERVLAFTMLLAKMSMYFKRNFKLNQINNRCVLLKLDDIE